MHRSISLFLTAGALLVGCGKDDGKAPAKDPGAGKAGSAGATAAPDDWQPQDHSDEPIATVHDAIGALRFAIDLPGDLDREATDHYVHWGFKRNPFIEPSITVQVIDPALYPADLDSAVRQANMITGGEEREVATRKETEGGGFLVTTQRQDGQFLRVGCWARNGDAAVEGTFIQRTGTGRAEDGPIPNLDRTRRWAEMICGSLRVDPPGAPDPAAPAQPAP